MSATLFNSLIEPQRLFKKSLGMGLVCVVVSSLFLSGCSEDQAVYQPAVAKLLEKASSLKKASQNDEALCRLKAAEDIMPGSFQVQYDLGVLYSEENHYLPAIEHLEKATSLSPSDANTLYSLGFTYEALGDAYQHAAKVSPQELQKPEFAFAKGASPGEMASKQKEAYQKAIETYQKFLKVASKDDTGRKDVQGQLQLLQAQNP